MFCDSEILRFAQNDKSKMEESGAGTIMGSGTITPSPFGVLPLGKGES